MEAPICELETQVGKRQVFNLGLVIITEGVETIFQNDPNGPYILLKRHSRGDWGDTCSDDALVNNGRLFSSYKVVSGTVNSLVWIITEADRSKTTVLLSSEY